MDVRVEVRSSGTEPSSRSALPALPLPQRLRHDRLHREADRSDFVAARVLARELVAAGAGVDADRVTLHQECPTCGGDDHGRPVVVVDGRTTRGVSVSWARSHGVVVAAVGLDCAVGVDLERTDRPFPHEVLTGPDLDAPDRDRAARDRAARDAWTRAEALVKLGVTSLDDALRRSVPDLSAAFPEVTVSSWEDGACAAHVALAVRRAPGQAATVLR